MSTELDVLGTHNVTEGTAAEPCILPLVVLFSIAAQENRGVANRVGRGRSYRVPMGNYGAGMGAPGGRMVPGWTMRGVGGRRGVPGRPFNPGRYW